MNLNYNRKVLTTLMLAGVTLLAACATPNRGPPTLPADMRPEIQAQSADSLKAQDYYERVQNSLLTHGLLRTDGGGPDVPFNARSLAQNFLKIALYQEYTEQSGRLMARESNSYLHRWNVPIRYDITFGASVPQARRLIDRREIRRYSQRLGRLTDLRFSQSSEQTNLHILIVNEDERRKIGPTLRAILPGISSATISSAENMARDTYCLAFASAPGQTGGYSQAIIIIRGEHPDLLRKSCIHEEIAQSMGLPNDSIDARPSIFNDDGEFGLLTSHDELLLRILYDPRLAPGMTEEQARPIVNTIATELLGGDA